MYVLHGDRGILTGGIRGLLKGRGFSKAFSTQVTITCIFTVLGERALGQYGNTRVKVCALQTKM